MKIEKIEHVDIHGWTKGLNHYNHRSHFWNCGDKGFVVIDFDFCSEHYALAFPITIEKEEIRDELISLIKSLEDHHGYFNLYKAAFETNCLTEMTKAVKENNKGFFDEWLRTWNGNARFNEHN